MLLDYLVCSIREDICASIITQPFMELWSVSPPSVPVPQFYVDEFREWRGILHKDEPERQVSLAETSVYVCPWNNTRTRNNLLRFRNHSFEYQEHGHDSVCCTAMDMCIVTKGYHSINAGRHFKKGLILSLVYHVEELFPHVRTDGRQ